MASYFMSGVVFSRAEGIQLLSEITSINHNECIMWFILYLIYLQEIWIKQSVFGMTKIH